MRPNGSRFIIATLLIVAVSLGLSTLAFAQGGGTFGTINGIVTDSTGAAVPKATVTVTNTKTGGDRTTVTNDTGNFSVPSLLPSSYRVQVEAPGFKKSVRPDFELGVNESVRVDMVLQVGAVTETIEVEAAAPMLQTGSGTVGTVISNQNVVELPLNGRDFTSLTMLTPGATQGNNAGGFFIIGGNNVSVTGNRSDSNNYTLDGVDNNENFFKYHAIKPSIDAIEEFKIQTNVTSAQFGSAAGANVNIATKSGTNAYHGSVFEFFRNDVLDAREYFAPERPALRFNDFGGTVGGPIKKDKIFWLFNYEGTRRANTSTILSTVPTDQMWAGNLSLGVDGKPAAQIYDPATARLVNGQIVRDPFPGNIIPTNRIDPITEAYKKVFYTGVSPNLAGVPNYINAQGSTLNTNQLTGRVDYRFNANTSIFGRYSQSKLDLLEPQNLPTNPRTRINDFHNVGIVLTHLISSTTIFDFRFGYNDYVVQFGNPNLVLSQPLRDAGLTALPDQFRGYDYPINLDMAGYSSVSNFAFQNGVDRNYQYLPNLLLIRGKHSISVGADIKHENIFHDGVFSNWNFTSIPSADAQNTANTGQSVASFLLGYPSTASRILGDPSLHAARWLTHFYAQDDIKVNAKLTINLGIRYELSNWFHGVDGRLSGYDTTTGGYMWASINPITLQPPNGPRTIVYPDRNNVCPRFGIAYLLTPKTTVRAGYGIFYNSNFTWETSSARGNWPYSISQSYEGMNAAFPTQPVGNVFPDTLDPSQIPPDVQHSMSRHQRVGYMQQFNVNIQRELANNLVLDVGFIGTKGTKLSSFFNANVALPGPGPVNPRRPFQNVGGFSEDQSVANSSYYGGTIKLEKRFSNNISFLTNFAYSKFIDLCSVFGCASPQNSYDYKLDYAPSDLNNKYIFSMGFVTQLPFGKGQKFASGSSGVMNQIVGGWEFNGIIAARSGRPFTILLPFDNLNNGQRSANQRASQIAPVTYPGTTDEYFSTSSFAVPQQYTYGNLGRNTLLGPNLQTWDFGLFKNFPITESMRIQFRTEFFNAFNHPNFSNPNGNLTDPAFGTISSTCCNVLGTGQNARQIQFGLKFIF